MPFEELWKTALASIELQISRPNFVTWFKNSELIEKNENTAVISFPNNFAKEWVENKYHKIVLKALRDIDKTTKNVIYTVRDNKIKSTTPLKSKEINIANNQQELLELKINPETNLNPRYTLSSFAVGKSNELAYAACLATIKEIGVKYNPLFIHGGVGVGKTHLIQAVGNEINNQYKNKIKVKYVPSERFINEVISGIGKHRMDAVKDTYRGVDVLIIDDIQHIGGKNTTQLEFFHTFNALYENNKQIILSSDRPPAFIPGLEERLRSRFSGGMIVTIDPPEYELRLVVLKNKLRERQVQLNENVIEFIAAKIQKNFRELEGALNRIIFYQQSKNIDITPKIAEQIINDITQTSNYNVTPMQIIKCVSDYYDVTPNDLVSRCRKKELVEPRQVAMYLMREIIGMSYLYIGEKLGKRDHTTVIYACEKIEQEVNKNHALNQKIVMIKDLISKC